MKRLVVTIGPSSIELDQLLRIKTEDPMHYRINLSHSNPQLLNQYYSRFREAGIPPSIDTQGAQLRVSSINGSSDFKPGQVITVGSCSDLTEPNSVSCNLLLNHSELFYQLEPKDVVKIGFDGLLAHVIEVDIPSLTAAFEIVNSGNVEVNKAIDIVDKPIDLSPLTDFDIHSLQNSKDHGVESVYLSFCDSAEQIHFARSLLLSSGYDVDHMPLVVAKIESVKALNNLSEIINMADAILIDRGDLSREVRISRIPQVVSQVIDSCKEQSVPCFIATNVLDSMIHDYLPSRAEISDISNLLIQGASGLVLAAETAIGKNPVESVQVLNYMLRLHDTNSSNFLERDSDLGVFSRMPRHLQAWL